MSGTVFELSPQNYLFRETNQCTFQIVSNTLPGKYANIYLIGDVFLKHFYSTFDVDRNEIGLGININSKD